MRIYLSNRLNMANVVLAYLENQSPTIINAAPGLQQDIQTLKSINNEINQLNKFQTIDRSGHRINKDKTRTAMINRTLQCATALMAFAQSQPSQVLFNEIKTTQTSLVRLRNNQLVARCKFIHLRALQNQANIETYGITTNLLNQFQLEIEAFNNQVEKPRLSIIERVQLTHKIELEFKKLTKLFQIIDLKIKALAILHPDFANHYKTCRIIINHRGTVLALTGIITNQNETPITGAICTLINLGKETKTTKKGNFEFKKIPNGQHILQVQRPGYETITQSISVVKGQTTKINLLMIPDIGIMSVA